MDTMPRPGGLVGLMRAITDYYTFDRMRRAYIVAAETNPGDTKGQEELRSTLQEIFSMVALSEVALDDLIAMVLKSATAHMSLLCWYCTASILCAVAIGPLITVPEPLLRCDEPHTPFGPIESVPVSELHYIMGTNMCGMVKQLYAIFWTLGMSSNMIAVTLAISNSVYMLSVPSDKFRDYLGHGHMCYVLGMPGVCMMQGGVWILLGVLVLMYGSYGNSIAIFSIIGVTWVLFMAFFVLFTCRKAAAYANRTEIEEASHKRVLSTWKKGASSAGLLSGSKNQNQVAPE